MTSDKTYQKIIQSLKKRKNGATVADISSVTALPLSDVRELLPRAADEFSGHLKVTQSGEILYTFPNGFTSRYRGLGAAVKRIAEKSKKIIKAVSVTFFKVWIMVMLIGYFVLFLALAVASVVISVAGKSSDRGGRDGGFGGFNLFGMLWRIWFLNEITRPQYEYGRVVKRSKEKRPMHKAIFSFIFGEEDPNRDWEGQESKAIIAYIQANRGVISLAEYMAFTGLSGIEAEESILTFCSRFAGSPEVTAEGTIVYRFEDLLLRADSARFPELSPPLKRLKTFSVNSRKMNGWFIVINAVNLIFGSYFLYNSFATGLLVTEIQYQTSSYLYAFTHLLLNTFTSDPVGIIRTALGIIPLVFSVFFWLIPAVRGILEKKENENTKLSNFKRFGFSKIWSSPFNVDAGGIAPLLDLCRPGDLDAAADRVIKDIGAISSPEVITGENGKTLYSFNKLDSEKRALNNYRQTIDLSRSQLGETVFDTEKRIEN
ncbi:MAG: hypothetical protein FWC03_00390 [Treponema sp.]|nr:hypothetical protein [Treponema sp.]